MAWDGPCVSIRANRGQRSWRRACLSGSRNRCMPILLRLPPSASFSAKRRRKAGWKFPQRRRALSLKPGARGGEGFRFTSLLHSPSRANCCASFSREARLKRQCSESRGSRGVPPAAVTAICDSRHSPLADPRLDCTVVAIWASNGPGGNYACNEIHQFSCDSGDDFDFCRGAANSGSDSTHRQARSHDQRPAELGQRDVQQLLRRLPWKRWQGHRPGSLGDEDSADRSDPSGAEGGREVSRSARRCSDQGTGYYAVARQPGYAGVGSALLEHQPRSRRAGTAENQQPGPIYRGLTGEVSHPGFVEASDDDSGARRARSGVQRRWKIMEPFERELRSQKEPNPTFPPLGITAQWSMSYCPLAVGPVTSVP